MTVGTPPGTGFQLIDSAWLAGLAGGLNQSAGLITANNANNQATATSIPSGVSLVEIDTAVNTGSVVLPAAVAGTEITIINNSSGNVINVFANAVTNSLTGALDTINALANGTAFGTAAGISITWIACAKNGKWFTK